jgi:hypothetical protein
MKMYGNLTAGLIYICATFPVYAADLPEWVMSPEYPGGIAAAECVISSGSLSLDKQQAAAEARVALAQQLEIKVKAVDKIFSERVSSGKNIQTKSTFQRASEQLSERVLSNSRIVKTQIVRNTSDGDKVCILLAMTPEATKEYFREMVKVANVDVPAGLEKDLFESFSKQQ